MSLTLPLITVTRRKAHRHSGDGSGGIYILYEGDYGKAGNRKQSGNGAPRVGDAFEAVYHSILTPTVTSFLVLNEVVNQRGLASILTPASAVYTPPWNFQSSGR